MKESGIKNTLPMCTVVPWVTNFCPFRSTISRFQDIAHFRIFPLTPMLKFQSDGRLRHDSSSADKVKQS